MNFLKFLFDIQVLAHGNETNKMMKNIFVLRNTCRYLRFYQILAYVTNETSIFFIKKKTQTWINLKKLFSFKIKF